VRPPLAGRREAARRLAGDVRRRLGLPAGGAVPPVVEPPPPPMTADQAAHRIDAARARLRATITPPEEGERGE